MSDQPVAGVIVTAIGSTDTVRTDASGRFRHHAWPLRRASASRGLGSRASELVATPGDTALRVIMTPIARTLEASTITAVRGDARRTRDAQHDRRGGARSTVLRAGAAAAAHDGAVGHRILRRRVVLRLLVHAASRHRPEPHEHHARRNSAERSGRSLRLLLELSRPDEQPASRSSCSAVSGRARTASRRMPARSRWSR